MRLRFVWLGIWVMTGLLLASHAFGGEPPRKSPLRSAVLDALRPNVERDLGQPVRFAISRLNVEEPWAFVSATPLTRDEKPIDWSRTRFAREFAQGFMSDAILALLRNGKNGWEVVEYALGPTDVTWEDWIARYQLPRRFFDPTAPEPESYVRPPPSRAPIEGGPVQWQTHHLGALTLVVPSGWRPLSDPSPLDLAAATWSGARFVENSRDVERGASLELAWGKAAAGFTRFVEDDDILGAETVDLFGEQAGRADFQLRNAKTDTRGFDVILEDEVRGTTFVLTCRAPPEEWPRVGDLCQEIVAKAQMNRTAPSASAQPTPNDEQPPPGPGHASPQHSPAPQASQPPKQSRPSTTAADAPASESSSHVAQPAPASPPDSASGWDRLSMLAGGLLALLGLAVGWYLGRSARDKPAQDAARSSLADWVRGRMQFAIWALAGCAAIGLVSLLSPQPLVTFFRLLWLAGMALMVVSVLAMVLTFRNAREMTPALLISALATCLTATAVSLLVMPAHPPLPAALISTATGALIGAAAAYSTLLYLDGEHVRMRGTAWSLIIWCFTLAVPQVFGLVVGQAPAQSVAIALLGAGVAIGNTLGLLLRLREAARLVPKALTATRTSMDLQTS